MNPRRLAKVSVAFALVFFSPALLGIGYVLAPDRSLPVCASEDSPSCTWVDPDTGITYVNGYDAGQSIEEMTGLPWCDAGRTIRPCLEVIPE